MYRTLQLESEVSKWNSVEFQSCKGCCFGFKVYWQSGPTPRGRAGSAAIAMATVLAIVPRSSSCSVLRIFIKSTVLRSLRRKKDNTFLLCYYFQDPRRAVEEAANQSASRMSKQGWHRQAISASRLYFTTPSTYSNIFEVLSLINIHEEGKNHIETTRPSSSLRHKPTPARLLADHQETFMRTHLANYRS